METKLTGDTMEKQKPDFTRFLIQNNKLDRFTISIRAIKGKTLTLPSYTKDLAPGDYLEELARVFPGEWAKLDHDWRNLCMGAG